MRFKLFTSVVLIALVAVGSTAWHRSHIPSQSRGPTAIDVVINQLPVINGSIPLEILRPVVSASTPNQIEEFTYTVRNNSARAITALAVSKKITYEEAGTSYTTSLYSTVDYAFHPDLSIATAHPFC